MIKRTIYEFTLPIIDDGDNSEYEVMVDAIMLLEPNGDVRGERIDDRTYQITIEAVTAA